MAEKRESRVRVFCPLTCSRYEYRVSNMAWCLSGVIKGAPFSFFPTNCSTIPSTSGATKAPRPSCSPYTEAKAEEVITGVPTDMAKGNDPVNRSTKYHELEEGHMMMYDTFFAYSNT